MALQINKQKEGKSASYFRIVKLWFNVDEKDMEIELRGYASKQDSNAAETGANTLQFTYKFTLSGINFPDVNKVNWYKGLYKEIKKSTLYGGWSNAIEV